MIIAAATFSACVLVSTSANQGHYLDESKTYRCAEGTVTLKGEWGEERQGAIKVRYSLGEAVQFETIEPGMPTFGLWYRSGTRLRLVNSDAGRVIDVPKLNPPGVPQPPASAP
jgi:hypothetical protein